MRSPFAGAKRARRALLQTARRLLARGMSPADVAELTDMSLEEVQGEGYHEQGRVNWHRGIEVFHDVSPEERNVVSSERFTI